MVFKYKKRVCFQRSRRNLVLFHLHQFPATDGDGGHGHVVDAFILVVYGVHASVDEAGPELMGDEDGAAEAEQDEQCPPAPLRSEIAVQHLGVDGQHV